jgi:hypothetical protein
MFIQDISRPITSGAIHFHRLPEPLKSGVGYASITVMKGGANLANQTNQWFCLATWDGSNFTTLRSTVNDTTAAWAASDTKTLALSSTYTPGSDTDCYIGVLVTVSSGTTGMFLASPGPISQGHTITHNVEPVLVARSNLTSYTTPVADATTIARSTGAVNRPQFYAYVS